MSTRQNKKQRKGRNNANNRERTVTTLTEDPVTHYLVPTPSEEPAGSHSVPFSASGAVGGKVHTTAMSSQPYQGSGNFSLGYSTPCSPVQRTNMRQQQQSQQQPFYLKSPQDKLQPASNKPVLPPGKNDLEILQNLKKMIKDGQHPFYHAIPAPAALASLYKGTIPSHARPESAGQQAAAEAPNFGSAARDNEKRQQPRRQGKDQRIQDKANVFTNAPGNRSKNGPAPLVSNLNMGGLQISKDTSGLPSPGPASAVPPPDRTHSMSMDVDRPQRDDSRSVFSQQPQSWPPRDAISSDGVSSAERGMSLKSAGTPNSYPAADATVTSNPYYATDRAVTPTSYYAADRAGSKPPSSLEGADHRPVSTQEYDNREYSSRRDWYPNTREDRRVVYERPSRDIRPPETHGGPLSASASAVHDGNVGHARPVPETTSVISAPDTQRPESLVSVLADALENSTHNPEIPPSVPESDASRPVIDVHPQQGTSSDHHISPPIFAGRAAYEEDIRSSRSSSARPADTSSGLTVSGPPPISAEGLMSVHEKIVAPPSLKERMTPNQFPKSQPKPVTEARQPIPATDAAAHPGVDQHPAPQQPQPQHQHQERFNKKKQFPKGHHFHGPGKFGRQGTPSDGAMPGGHAPRNFRPRSPSLDGRRARDYRVPPPPTSRDIERDRVAYRAEYDPRRPDILEPHVPPPVRYDSRPYGEFAPPLSGERRSGAYNGSPPPMSGGRSPPGPPGRGNEYYPYPDRGDWPVEDDDQYKPRGWERPPPSSSERERFERDMYGLRPPVWDARQERDFIPRDSYGPGPSGPPIPLDDRYPPGPPISRDSDRSGHPPPSGYPAPYSRVRGRSPSPIIGRGGGSLDDSRPPLKRAREDFPPDYYQGGRPPPHRPSISDYPPPRSGRQLSSSDWPPPVSAGPGGAGPPPRSGRGGYRGREPPLGYAPAGYERPRTPQGGPARLGYGPPGHDSIHDRGGYPPRPPQ